MSNIIDSYSTVAPLIPAASLPTWISNDFEKRRIASYEMFEQIYWDYPNTFKLLARGEEDNPIYVPSGRKIIETMHRYLAPKMRMICDPLYGTPDERNQAMITMTELLRRERFYSQFSMNKRYGLIKGDWTWHIFADPLKPDGSRITIEAIDPSRYFPIYNPDNVSEITGCHLVDQYVDDEGKPWIRRLTYRKVVSPNGTQTITSEDAIFKIDDWGGPGMDQEANPDHIVTAVTTLDPRITQLPVYNIPNVQVMGQVYGVSELAGLERMIAAINQGISDEELSLAMDGIGVYTTDAGTPLDPITGQATTWNLGPGRVIELPDGKTFERVSGVSSVSPYQDHLKYLHEQLDQAAQQPAIAQGRVDVAVAESGIALFIELSPMLSRAEEKELVITDVLSNMFFDLRNWILVYEPTLSSGIENTRFIPIYGDHVPENRANRFKEILALFTAKLVSAEWCYGELAKIGYTIDDATLMLGQIVKEQTAIGQVAQDATGTRVDAELNSLAPPDPNAGA
jgi:hypothetical protein